MPEKTELSKSRDRILELPEDEQRDVILEDLKTSEDRRKNVNIANRRFRKMYFQKDEIPIVSEKESGHGKSEGRSHVYLPYARSMADSALSLLSRIIFPQDKNVAIEPTEVDDIEHSAAFEDLLYYRFGRAQMNLKQLFREQFLFQLLIYDCVVGRVGWLLRPGYVPQKNIFEKIINLAFWRWAFPRTEYTMERKNDAVDRSEFEVLDTLRIRPDPTAIDFDDSRFFMYLKDTGLSALRRREKTDKNEFGIWKNLKKVTPDSYPGKESESASMDINKNESEDQPESDRVELIPYHTPDAMVVLANRKWVIRERRMPGYPFTKGSYIQPSGQWEGMGLIEGIEHLQLHINQLFRLSMDNDNAINGPVSVISRELLADVENRNIKLWHGKCFVTSGDPSKAIWRDRPPDLTQGFQPKINFLIYLGERLTNISENAQGVAPKGGRRTATEAGLIAAGLETGVGEIASSIEDKNIADIVYLTYNQEILNLTKAAKFRILGRKGAAFRTIERDGILHRGSFDVRPLGSKFFANKVMQVNQFMQGIDLTGKTPHFQQIANWEELYKRMWTHLGEKNPERLTQDGSANDYRVPPEMENMLLTAGHVLELGNQDNDQEHIPIHTQAMDATDYPPENREAFEEHIEKHNQRILAMEQGGSVTQMAPSPEVGAEGGGAELPTEEANVIADPFQTFGGMRTPNQ